MTALDGTLIRQPDGSWQWSDGVAIETSIVTGRATHLVFPEHEDRRPYRFGEKTGKVEGMPWRAERATDEEVAEALAELSAR